MRFTDLENFYAVRTSYGARTRRHLPAGACLGQRQIRKYERSWMGGGKARFGVLDYYCYSSLGRRHRRHVTWSVSQLSQFSSSGRDRTNFRRQHSSAWGSSPRIIMQFKCLGMSWPADDGCEEEGRVRLWGFCPSSGRL